MADDMARPALQIDARVTVEGRRLVLGGRPFSVRGTTYGTARFPDPACTLSDLIAIADLGFNTICTPRVPPRFVLELAPRVGLQQLSHAHRHDAERTAILANSSALHRVREDPSFEGSQRPWGDQRSRSTHA